jgi:hypothetical protein
VPRALDRQWLRGYEGVAIEGCRSECVEEAHSDILAQACDRSGYPDPVPRSIVRINGAVAFSQGRSDLAKQTSPRGRNGATAP